MTSIKKILFGTLLDFSLWRIAGSVLFIVIFSYLGLVVYIYFFQANLIYLPTYSVDHSPADLGLAYDELWLPVADQEGRVHAWSILAAPGNDRGRWVLFCHGNAGNIGDRLTLIDMFHRLGFSTLIFDYRGYGKSPGRPSERNTYEDVAAGWHWLIEEQGVEPGAIMVYGRSLGGAIAAWLAQEKQPGMVVVESAFTSIADMGRLLYPFLPVRWLTRYRYPTRSYLASYEGPVLIMHSKDDEMMPMSMGRELYAVAAGKKRFVELKGGHNEVIYVMGDKYEQLLDQKITELWP